MDEIKGFLCTFSGFTDGNLKTVPGLTDRHHFQIINIDMRWQISHPELDFGISPAVKG
jgi:hypothetical protein